MGKTIRSMGIMLLNLCICISLIGSPAYAKNKAKDQSKEEDEVIVVSLGDSYSAGEGIEPFYGQGLAIKDKVLNEDWLAHPGRDNSRFRAWREHWLIIRERTGFLQLPPERLPLILIEGKRKSIIRADTRENQAYHLS